MARLDQIAETARQEREYAIECRAKANAAARMGDMELAAKHTHCADLAESHANELDLLAKVEGEYAK